MDTFKHEKLREIRNKMGYTQAEMAGRIGIARTTYADYENGRIQPPIDRVQKMCATFDLRLGELLPTENNTGIKLETFKTKRKLTDEEKIILINTINKKLEIYNGLDDAALIVDGLDITQSEKDLVINLLHYIGEQYQLTANEWEAKDRLDKAKKQPKMKTGFVMSENENY